MRNFTLREPDFEIPQTGILLFRWAGLDMEIANQLAFEEQYLHFQRHLLDNLESTPTEATGFKPTPLTLSLRAGAIKSYVVFASSIVEGALAALGEKIGLSTTSGALYKKPLGGLLRVWEVSGSPRPEIVPIWDQLQLLKEYRNFIHLGRAANDPKAYWQQVLDREAELVGAVDTVIDYLSYQCNGIRKSDK